MLYSLKALHIAKRWLCYFANYYCELLKLQATQTDKFQCLKNLSSLRYLLRDKPTDRQTDDRHDGLVGGGLRVHPFQPSLLKYYKDKCTNTGNIVSRTTTC